MSCAVIVAMTWVALQIIANLVFWYVLKRMDQSKPEGEKG